MDYFEEESDIIGAVLKTNIKQDPGSMRAGRRLISPRKLNLEDEDKIHPMPKDIISKPDDKLYEKSVQSLKDKIDYHEHSINEIKEKIKNEKYGNNPLKTKLELKSQVKENDTEIKTLKTQIELIKEEIKKCKNEINLLNDERDSKWLKYEKQQKIISYINEANEQLKIKVQKDNQRREREKEDQGLSQDYPNTDKEAVKSIEEIRAHDHEILLCEWLGDYFRNINRKKEEEEKPIVTNDIAASSQSKLDDDINKGYLKPIDRENKENEYTLGIGLTSGERPKKKSKAPTMSKRAQKIESSNMLNLDISVIQKIKELNLSPPVYKSEIPAFLDKLSKALEAYKTSKIAIEKTVYVQKAEEPFTGNMIEHVTVYETTSEIPSGEKVIPRRITTKTTSRKVVKNRKTGEEGEEVEEVEITEEVK